MRLLQFHLPGQETADPGDQIHAEDPAGQTKKIVYNKQYDPGKYTDGYTDAIGGQISITEEWTCREHTEL